MRNWVTGIAYIIGDDPDQPYEEAGEHKGSEPLWALLWKRRHIGNFIRNVERILLAALGLRHE